MSEMERLKKSVLTVVGYLVVGAMFSYPMLYGLAYVFLLRN